jgi:hypothetical protein
MTTELSEQLRQFSDLADPITMDEVRCAVASTSTWQNDHRSRASTRNRVLVASAAVLLVGGVGAFAAPHLTSLNSGSEAGSQVLSPAQIRLVADSTTAALGSGTAVMTITQTQNGAKVLGFDTNVTFSGSNVDMAIKQTNFEATPGQEPGQTATSTSDIRVVDGIAYRNLNGQWEEETGPNASRFLTFPDPRTIVGKIGASADLVAVGTDVVNGVSVTHYVAREASAVGNLGITGLGSRDHTTFDLWVDSDNVVQRLSAGSTSQAAVCVGQVTPSTLPLHCTPQPGAVNVDITYSHAGDPETITAPTGAVPGSWPSN